MEKAKEVLLVLRKILPQQQTARKVICISNKYMILLLKRF